MNHVYVIIVAAGTGSRFGSNIPKQFMPLGIDGVPVLMHSITKFLKAQIPVENIRVALHRDMIGFWEELCVKFNFRSPQVIVGGSTRFYSVKNALSTLQCNGADTIMVHDGVRPLVTREVIMRVHETLLHEKAVIPVVPVTDSLREVEGSGFSHAVDRSKYVSVQTPQGFRAEILFRAYDQPFRDVFTDDASVVEALGEKVALVEGSYKNIKITNRDDLDIAQMLLKKG